MKASESVREEKCSQGASYSFVFSLELYDEPTKCVGFEMKNGEDDESVHAQEVNTWWGAGEEWRKTWTSRANGVTPSP